MSERLLSELKAIRCLDRGVVSKCESRSEALKMILWREEQTRFGGKGRMKTSAAKLLDALMSIVMVAMILIESKNAGAEVKLANGIADSFSGVTEERPIEFADSFSGATRERSSVLVDSFGGGATSRGEKSLADSFSGGVMKCGSIAGGAGDEFAESFRGEVADSFCENVELANSFSREFADSFGVAKSFGGEFVDSFDGVLAGSSSGELVGSSDGVSKSFGDHNVLADSFGRIDLVGYECGDGAMIAKFEQGGVLERNKSARIVSDFVTVFSCDTEGVEKVLVLDALTSASVLVGRAVQRGSSDASGDATVTAVEFLIILELDRETVRRAIEVIIIRE